MQFHCKFWTGAWKHTTCLVCVTITSMGIFFLGALMSDDQSFSIMLLQGGHVDTASYRLAAFDKDWTLDVKRNKYVLSCVLFSYFLRRTCEQERRTDLLFVSNSFVPPLSPHFICLSDHFSFYWFTNLSIYSVEVAALYQYMFSVCGDQKKSRVSSSKGRRSKTRLTRC